MNPMSFVSSLVAEAPLGGSPLLTGLLVIAGFLLGLRGVRRGVQRLLRVGKRVLILGESPLGRQVIEAIERQQYRRFTIVGVVHDVANLGRVIEATRPDRIVVALDERRGRLPLHRLVESLARGIVVEDAAETYERLTGKLALEALLPSRVIFSGDFRTSRLQRGLARVLSFLVATIGSIVLAPLLGVIVLLIKLDSRGPAFFIQERVGLSGRAFKLIKFRTMQPVSCPKSEWERDNYDRITRLGRWLRRFRLDELPQLVNVVRGDMNLVGPRPHPVTNLGMMILAARNLNELTGDAIPYYSLRCAVRPGITGWAQIRHGYANNLDEETEKMRYDLYYVKHMSLGFDLRILFETARIVVRGTPVTAATRQNAAPEPRPSAAVNP
jgi:lipopolysaccharide/colanic/teichoic acid biosynthesis glycosyltransferase